MENQSTLKISVIGMGFVGSAMFTSFHIKGMRPGIDLFSYDKFLTGPNIHTFEECLDTDIMFLALPTKYISSIKEYDKSAIYQTCEKLESVNFEGLVVIKSTVEPETTEKLLRRFPKLNFVHNPEFLSAKTAFEDFHNQKHIVLGRASTCCSKKVEIFKSFYKKHYPQAQISECTALESESMKIFCNCFYAVKIQFFTEIYLLCQKTGCDYNTVRNMMLSNGWINPMHTVVPCNGQISYGGYCFPKDTNALNQYMLKMETSNAVLEACIEERNKMRTDHTNQE